MALTSAVELRAVLSVGEVLPLLSDFVAMAGADAGLFDAVTRDDSGLTFHQSLLACDAAWGVTYVNQLKDDDGPWLRYAARHVEPMRTYDLGPFTASDEAFLKGAAEAGFRWSMAVPAPTCHGSARFGVLVLGRDAADFPEGAPWDRLCVAARSFAMELHAWLMRSTTAHLAARIGLDASDIELLKLHIDGHGSKAIATRLGTQSKTVDCRFQRLCVRLGVPDRRTAARYAQLHELI